MASALIQWYFGKQVTNTSFWLKRRSERQLNKFFADISKIIDSPERRIMLQIAELKDRINCGLSLLLGCVIFVLNFLIYTISIPRDTITFIVNIVLQIAGILMFFICPILIDSAAYKSRVITECQRYIDHDIFIHSARYGANGAENDVTNFIRNAVNAGRLRIAANNRLGGDPSPDRPKDLTVVYSYAGQQRSIKTPENEWLSLPEAQ